MSLRTRFFLRIRGLMRPGSGNLPFDGSPTLILDFAPTADPIYGASLDANFMSSLYTANEADPIAPTALLNIQVWN